MVILFLKYIREEKRYSNHTYTSYQHDLGQFTNYLKQEYELESPEEASFPMLRGFIVWLAEQDMEPKSIQRKITSLRSYYKFLVKHGHITKDPTIKIKAPKSKKSLPVFVEEQNIFKLLDNQDLFEKSTEGMRDHLILEMLYGTGIRLSELIGLKEEAVQMYESQMKVLGKGNKERIIPIHQALKNQIKEYSAAKKREQIENKEGYLFVTNSGDKTYPMLIYRIVRKFLDLATTVDKRSPHVLRHTFATHLLNKGAELNAIKELLGHSSLAATQVYTHNSLDKLKSIFNQAHPKS